MAQNDVNGFGTEDINNELIQAQMAEFLLSKAQGIKESVKNNDDLVSKSENEYIEKKQKERQK